MKVIRKSDGKAIEVKAVNFLEGDGSRYNPSDLDFNLPEEKGSAVIEGWVCRDKEICEHYYTDLWFGTFKPIRKLDTYWAASKAALIPLKKELFPSLIWESEPMKVRIQ